MVTRSEVHRQVDEERYAERHLSTFEQRLARTERRIANRGRTIGRDVRRGYRYVTKNKKKLRKKPVRTVAGMTARTVGVTLAGTGKTLAYTGKISAAGYRKAKPRVAGMANRAGVAAYAYAYAYGGPAGARAAERGQRMVRTAGHASRQARSHAVRTQARVRTQRRRVAGRMHQHAERYRQQNRTGLARVTEQASRLVNVREHRPNSRIQCAGCGASFRTVGHAARHECQAAIQSENAAIARAKKVAGHNPKTRPAEQEWAGRTRQGGSTMAPNAPKPRKASAAKSKHLEVAGFEPNDYEDWMSFLHSKAAEHKREADALQELAERMDTQYGMDPRSLAPLYAGAELQQVLAQSYVTSYADFWKLYQNRVEEDAEHGRVMKDEGKFFQK